jgi:hypothetical protein
VPILGRDIELDLADDEARLLVATIDRRLAGERAAMMPRGRRSHTKPGSLLESQIAIRAWADWGDAVPGFVEIDLIGHEGGNASGEFCFTLTVTDIATGWTVNRSVRNKAARWVFEALEHVIAAFPSRSSVSTPTFILRDAGARPPLLYSDWSRTVTPCLLIAAVGGRRT